MSHQLSKIAAFGTSKTGLSAVAYQLYNSNGTTNGSLVSAGISEIGGGAYGALVTFPDAFQGFIRWTSGEGSPVFASEDVDVTLLEANAAIKVQTDKMAFTVANQIDSNVLDWKSATAPAMTGDAYARIGAAGAGLTAVGDTAGTTTLLSRLSAARAGYLDVLNGIVAAIWAAVSDSAGVTTLLARIASALTITAGKVDVNDKTGFALTSGERTAIANEVEAQIIDETDSEKVLTAITDKIASVNPSLGSLTLAAIASQVRTELTTELTRIDAAISSRSTYAGGDTSGVTTLLARLTAIRAGLLDNLDAAISSRGTGVALDAAGVRSALGVSSANLDTQLDALPTNTELATALASADDAVLAAIAALNNISQANVRTALGLGAANLDTQLATIAGYIDTEVAAIKAVVDKLNTALELDGSTYRFTVDALAEAPISDCATAVEIRQEIDTNSTQLQAIRAKTDDISPGSITVLSPVTLSGGLITITQGTTVHFDDLQGLGSLTGRSKLYFTVKLSLDDSDEQAIIQIEETDGLVKLNGSDAANDEDGSITVDDESAGDVTIEIKPRASSALPVTTSDSNAIYYYDVKKIAVDDTRPLVNGRFKVNAIVTDAIE